jgi:hypothetical protein
MVLVVLSATALLVTTITAYVLTNRHFSDRRGQQMQAAWLARAGIELACSRLMIDPAMYTGESIELIPNSRIRISVHSKAASPNDFLITSEARYPTDAPNPVMRSVSCRITRVAERGNVDIKVHPASAESSPSSPRGLPPVER